MSNLLDYTVYNGVGEVISKWATKRSAVAAAVELKKTGEVGHYVVNERNAQLVWIDWRIRK